MSSGSKDNVLGDKRTVAVFHPRVGFGGSEAVAMWALEALKREFDVSIVTTNAVDLAALNSFYGTAVREGEVKVRQLPIPRMLSGIRSGAAIRGALFQSAIRQAALRRRGEA